MRRSRVLPFLSLLCAIAWVACGGGSDNGPGGAGGSGGGSGSCPSDPGVPKACSATPDSGGETTEVVILGANFPTLTANVKVKFFGGDGKPRVESQVTDAKPDRITTKVPSKAVTGPIELNVDLGSGFISVPGPFFTVTDDKPVPVLSSLSPASVTAGEPVDVVLSGSGFRSSSTVEWNKQTISSTYTSGQIKVHLSEDMVAVVGTYKVRVVSPPPGGGVSQELDFKVVPALHVVSAEPISATQVRVTFDRAVGSNAAPRQKPGQVYSFSPALTVKEAKLESSGGKTVIVSTSLPQTPDVNYTVTVASSVTSADGGILKAPNTAGFRAFNSAPIPDGDFGTAPGCGPTALSGPRGLVVMNDALYVTEESGNQVQKISIAGDDPEFLGFFGYDGTTTGLLTAAGSNAAGCPGGSTTEDQALVSPRGAPGVDPLTGNVYAADTARDRLVRFVVAGATASFESFLRGDAASATADRWTSPVVLGVIGKTLYFVASDDKIHRIGLDQTREPDPFGGIGNGGGQFRFNLSAPPDDCATDDARLECAYDGSGVPAMAYEPGGKWFYVVEPGNHRVQRLRLDSAGKVVADGSTSAIGKGVTKFAAGNTQAKGAGTGKGEFTNPCGIALDKANSLYVVDEAKGGRVQRFDSGGNFQKEITLGFLPGGIAIDSSNRMWIADPLNGKLHRFKL